MASLKNNLFAHKKRAQHVLGRFSAPDRYVHNGVPYFSQWESPSLIGRILEKEIGPEDDPNWKLSGAKDKNEYTSWSWSGCGMACTKMLIAHLNYEVIPLVDLGKKCMEYGGYILPLETSPGLFYKPYVTFVEKEFSWKARIVSGMILPEIAHELSKGNYIVASVNPQIRHPKSMPRVKGGHLVLLLGYDKAKKEIYLHNSSGASKATQEYASISYRDFMKFFSGRGIVIQGSN